MSDEVVLSDKLVELAGLLREAAGQYQAEATKVAAEHEELTQLRRQLSAGQVAKLAADQGFIDDGQVDSYADSLLGDENTDLNDLLTKMSSATPRVRLGAADSTITMHDSEGAGEGRLVSRLTRNA